ncbi:MAG: hypothetical protein ACYCVH_04740 [Ignavibacteriaceae bacterium]
MFEKEIKFITDYSLNKVKKFGSFFTFEKLLSSDVHPAIIQYISAELDFLIYEDRKKLLQQSAFDYTGLEIAKHFNIIGEEIKKNKKISFEDMKNLMLQAVSFNINFLVRPRWSLTKLTFNESEQRTFEEIKLAFNYIYYYDYLKNIFLSYLAKRKLPVLSVTEFEAILSKIDKELFSSQAEKFLDNVVLSTAEFFNEGGVNKTKISPAYFELFLKEKNLIDYQFKVRKYFPADSNQNFEIEDFRKVLYSTTPVQLPQKAEEEINAGLQANLFEEPHEENHNISREEERGENQTSIFEQDEISNRKTDENVRDILQKENSEQNIEQKENELEPGIIDDELLSLYDSELKSIEEELKEIKTDLGDFEFEIESDESPGQSLSFEVEKEEEKSTKKSAKQNAEEIKVPEDASKNITINDSEDEIKLVTGKKSNFEIEGNKKAKDETTVNPDRKIIKHFEKDVYEYLSRKDIRKIILSVFNEDREDFESTVAKISECISYDEATEILKSVFITYRVNPYSKEAVTLTNAVSNYFDQA